MEEELTVAEEGQGDAGSSEGESGVDMTNSSPGPTKRGRGRPKGSKKLQVWVTHVDLLTDLSNGGISLPKKGRGRPKGSLKHKPEIAMSGEEEDCISSPPRKRGRPKGSLNKKTLLSMEREVSSEGESGTELSNGNPNLPKRGRGRPKKVQVEREEEESVQDVSNGGSKPQRGRGRPRKGPPTRGRPRKYPLPSPEELEKPKERKPPGRPRKHLQVDPSEELSTSSSSCTPTHAAPRKRGRPPGRSAGRGRPKGSFSQKPPSLKVHSKVGRPRKVVVPYTVHKGVTLSSKLKKRDRPRKEPNKRGRPRKYPLPSPEEMKKPKVWKPLGRPRKYPRADPPEEDAPSPRRGRGRPRKLESKRGAHLRKSGATTLSSLQPPSDGTPRKRGRPSNTVKGENGAPRKRGRPKGSLNKHKAVNQTRVETSIMGKRPRRLKQNKVSSVNQGEHEGGESETEHKVVKDEGMDQEVGFAPLDESDLSGTTEAAMN